MNTFNNQNQSISLPPLKHVFKGLFNTNANDQPPMLHQRRSSFGYDSTIEAARSLQQLSSPSCFYYPSPTYNEQPVLQFSHQGHRRTVSASSQPYIPQTFPIKRARAHTTSGYPPTIVYDSNTPKNRYHCQHCKKSFSRPSSLRIHIYSHTGEKPFKCNFPGCERSFSVHSNMRRHLRVHYDSTQQQKQNLNNSMRLPIVPKK